MNDLPMSQGMDNGPWGYEEETFALPAPKKLPKQMNWKCSHCGTANSNTEAIEFHWPDRLKGAKKGYVASCKSCGCRKLLMALAQPETGQGNTLPPPPPPPPSKPPVLKILLGILAGITALILIVMVLSGKLGSNHKPKLTSGSRQNPVADSMTSDGNEEQTWEEPETETETEPEEVTQYSEQTQELAYEDSPTDHMGITGIGPVDADTLNSLPESITTGEWDNKGRKVQGMDWNSDNNQRVFFSIASYVAVCDLDGNRRADDPTKTGYYYSMDYYNGIVFDVWRTPDYGRFRLEMRDPNTMEIMTYNLLSDMHDAYKEEKKLYGDKLCACIDGITLAPRIGKQDKLMVYVSYNTYMKGEATALNREQTLYEYDYQDVLSSSKEKLKAERVLTLDIGTIDYGIQTLEMDRSTGNIWCAVRPGRSEYSLYCIDGKSKGTNLSLVPNGDQMGWNCSSASDGFCSLGHDQFYLLIPYKNKDWVTLEARKVGIDELEDYN